MVRFSMTLPDQILKRLDELAEEKGVSRNAFIITIIDEYLSKLPPPALEHINLFEDRVTILDRRISRYVDVLYRRGRLYCSYDESETCPHVTYALTLDEVKKALKRRR